MATFINFMVLLFTGPAAPFTITICTVAVIVGATRLITRNTDKAITAFIGSLSLALVVGALYLPTGGLGYVGDLYEDDFVVTDEAIPTASGRASVATCTTVLGRNLADMTGTPVTDTVNYVDADTCTMVISHYGGMMSNPAQGVVSYDHRTGRTTQCYFDFGRDKLSFSRSFVNSVKAELLSTRKGIVLDRNALYGVCAEDGTARAFWPAISYEGRFPHRKMVHGGLFVIESDGSFEYHESADAGDFPGPVYPERLVRDHIGRYRTVFGDSWRARAGVATPANEFILERSTGLDIIGGGEFTMYSTDEQGYFITPMERLGGSGTTIAFARVDATSFTAGQRNDVVIHELDEDTYWGPMEQLFDEVAANERISRSGASLTVREIVPTSPDTFEARVGNESQDTFRVVLRRDRSPQVFDLTQERSTGNETGETDSQDEPTHFGGVEVDLSELSSDELMELQRALTEEIDTRLGVDTDLE